MRSLSILFVYLVCHVVGHCIDFLKGLQALLQWKEVKQHKAPPSGSKAEEMHLIMARYQQRMKATLAAVGVGEDGELPSLPEQLETAQKINAGLQSLLEDEQHAKVEQMQVI